MTADQLPGPSGFDYRKYLGSQIRFSCRNIPLNIFVHSGRPSTATNTARVAERVIGCTHDPDGLVTFVRRPLMRSDGRQRGTLAAGKNPHQKNS